MAIYKIYNTSSGQIDNIVEWDGTSSFNPGEGYAIELITSSIDWTGSYLENPINSYAGGFVGTFVGELYGSSSYALTASYALNGGTGGNFDPNNVDHLTFDTTPTTAVSEGTFVWNDGDGTLDLGLKGGNVTLQVGQQEYAMAYNAEITHSLLKGDVVIVSGSQGNRIAVKKASAVAEEGSRNTIGVAAENIAVGSEGLILLSGVLHGLNTTSSNAGATLYLDTVSGKYTETRPIAPYHTVIVGFVQRVHASQGSIFVKVDNGYELGELHNVLTNGVTTGDLLSYDGTNWTHKKILTGSYKLSGSLDVSGSVTASFAGWFTGSFSGSYTGSLYGSSSYATTSSYVQSIKSGIGSSWQQAGITNEFEYVVTFDTPYTNNDYSVSIVGEDLRIWSVASKTSIGFTIMSNSQTTPLGNVYWTTVPFNS